MASTNYQLQQQRSSVETRIKSLINNDLKEICKAYGYAVSGNKAHLQQRCIEILRSIVNRDDRQEFDRLNYRVNNHGRAPPHSLPAVATPNFTPKGGYNSPAASYVSPAHTRPLPTSSSSARGRLPPALRLFKTSPFYDLQESLLPLEFLPEYPQNRNTVSATLRLNPDLIFRLSQESNLRLMLYCGVDGNLTPTSPPIDVAFPAQVEVKINGDDVKSNFKGLKNKPGSTKPADITDRVRKTANYGNQISVVYALTTKRFVFGIYLARYNDAAALTERIRHGRFIPKQTVLDEMNKSSSDDEIAAMSVRMSLKDPISTIRITTPVRSDRCMHNQCFDVSMFMQLQEQAPQWTCPVCNRSVAFENLRVDKYFEEILQNTPKWVEKVDIEPNGDWHVIKEDEGNQNKSNGQTGHQNGARASYDDDSDDELEIMEIKSEGANGSSAGMWQSARATPVNPATTNGHVNTPPFLSREPSVTQPPSSRQLSNQPLPSPAFNTGTKRPTSTRPSNPVVIDLISSDEEEDEPPRPAKRQSTMRRAAEFPPMNISNKPGDRNDYNSSGLYGNNNNNNSQFPNARGLPPGPIGIDRFSTSLANTASPRGTPEQLPPSRASFSDTSLPGLAAATGMPPGGVSARQSPHPQHSVYPGHTGHMSQSYPGATYGRPRHDSDSGSRYPGASISPTLSQHSFPPPQHPSYQRPYSQGPPTNGLHVPPARPDDPHGRPPANGSGASEGSSILT